MITNGGDMVKLERNQQVTKKVLVKKPQIKQEISTTQDYSQFQDDLHARLKEKEKQYEEAKARIISKRQESNRMTQDSIK